MASSGTTFASLCQISIAESKLHQLVGYAFMSLFLALSVVALAGMAVGLLWLATWRFRRVLG